MMMMMMIVTMAKLLNYDMQYSVLFVCLNNLKDYNDVATHAAARKQEGKRIN